VKNEDEEEFQRAFSMLQPVYSSAAEAGLGRSQHENLLMALHLMFLLVENRTAEFHMELELLPAGVRQDKFLHYVIQVEQWMMDGAYSKVSESSRSIPDPGFQWFVSMLASTVCSEVASCIEKAYPSLKVADAKGLLMVPGEADVLRIAEERGWQVEDGVLRFQKDAEGAEQKIPAVELITNSLMYARELERIV